MTDSPGPTQPAAEPAIDLPSLERNLRSVRSMFSFAMTLLVWLLSSIAALPLVSVLYMLVRRGGENLSLASLTDLPPAANDTGGGFGNAILGTAYMVGIASLLAMPIGILAAVHLAEFGRTWRTTPILRFGVKVLTGLPSILAGVFAFAFVVLTTRKFSALAGGIALSVLMLPTVVLTTEEAIRSVPARMREAAFGMGATRAQVVCRVVLPTALPGILTGVMLAIARAAGETAPLLFTAMFSYHWPNLDRLEPTASLAVLIYNFASVPYQNQVEVAWTASLALVFLVFLVNLAGQLLARRSSWARR